MAINVTDLKFEFGTYLGTNMKDLLRQLTQKTRSMEFMTTIQSADLEYRAAQAAIDSVVQGFQKAWTAKSTPTFTPRSIPQRRHKVDLEFYPDDVVDSWLGFLTDETKDRKTWPITRYIIEQLVISKVNSDRELLLIGQGDYIAPTPSAAQTTGLSMDGFCTILEDLKLDGTSAVNFIDLEALTTDNIFDQVEAFVDGITNVYQSTGMNIFLSPEWYIKYLRKRRDLYGMNVDYGTFDQTKIDGTNLTLVSLPSMIGKDIIFSTPKENFIRLMNRNDGASNIAVENVDRLIKVYADWYESVGFGIEEAVFAYVPDESASE